MQLQQWDFGARIHSKARALVNRPKQFKVNLLTVNCPFTKPGEDEDLPQDALAAFLPGT